MAVTPDGGGHVRLTSPVAIEWQAGHEYVLIAVRRVLDAGVGVTLSLPDDGPERERVRFTEIDLDLLDVVTHDGGPADIALVAPLVAAAAPAALPPGPVVVTDVGGLPALAADRTDSRVVPPRDPAALAAGIVELTGTGA